MPQELAPHVQWLADNRGHALRAVLDAQGADIPVEQALQTLVSADPSPGHHAVQWLSEALVEGGMRWEDVASGTQSRAAQTLGWFAQHRAGLPPGQRNLEDYRSLGSVYAALAPFVQPETSMVEQGSRELRRAMRQQAYGDSIAIHQDGDMVVAVPLTRQASQWWGRGTRWCTAAREDNMFERYHKMAPLVVIVLRDPLERYPGQYQGKLQLYVPTNSDEIQFMDESDEPVDASFVARHWSRLGSIVEWAQQRKPAYISHVPPQHRTRQMCLEAVQTDGLLLGLVPAQYRDEAMCRAAVANTGMALNHVPAQLRSTGMCQDAVEDSPASIVYIPHGLRTQHMCLTAVRKTAYTIHYVPQEHMSQELHVDVLCRRGELLERVRPKDRNAVLCQAAMRGRADLELVPVPLRSRSIIELALGHNGRNLRHIAHADQDRALCMLAVGAEGNSLQHVRPDLLDRDMAMAAVVDNGYALRLVPPHLHSPELYAAAVGCRGDAIKYVPAEHRTRELCKLAVQSDGNTVSAVPLDILDEELCMIALTNTPWVMIYLGKQTLGPGAVSAAITRAPEVYELIHNPDPGVLESCVPLNGLLLKYVDPQLRTPQLCMAAVASNMAAIEHVPQDLRKGVLQAIPGADRAECQWLPRVALAGLADSLAHRLQGEIEPGMGGPGQHIAA